VPPWWPAQAPRAAGCKLDPQPLYFPAGVGWYRKAFTAPASWRGRRVRVEFDGVYMDATVYLNGRKLGTHANG
jgi:beta-galactosidase